MRHACSGPRDFCNGFGDSVVKIRISATVSEILQQKFEFLHRTGKFCSKNLDSRDGPEDFVAKT